MCTTPGVRPQEDRVWEGSPWTNHSDWMHMIQIPLIIPPVSHKEIRRILGWLLLPLSRCLPKAPKSTLIWGHLPELRWKYAQITQMYPIIHSPTGIPPKYWVPIATPNGDPSDHGSQIVLDHVGLKTIHPTIPCNQSQALLGCKLSTHGTILESQ